MARHAVVSGGGTGIGKAVARRLAADGARVTILGRRADALARGALEINDATGADRVSTLVTPVGRPGTPEEVAEAVAYLASEQAGFTTGQILQVNGGMVLGRG